LSEVKPSPAIRQQILVLNSYQVGLPIPDSIDRGLLTALREGGFSISDIFIEHLDFPRVSDKEHRANMAVLLDHKFSGKHIGVVFLEGIQAIDFMVNEGLKLFPHAALFTLATPNIDPLLGGSRKVVDIPWKVDPAGTLQAALELWPKTRRIFVITGANDTILPFLEEAKKAFKPWANKLDFEYSDKMTYEEMLSRVSSLPPNSIIIYSPFFTDSAGRSFIPAEVATKVGKVAIVPVFITLEAYLGNGIVGGSLLKSESIGYEAGRISLDYMNGRTKLIDPVTTFEASPKMMFNWNELTRWKTDMNRIPEESIVINRPLTLWGQYKEAVILSGFVLLALALMVFRLGFLNRRLLQMKEVANESEARFKIMVERAPEAIIVYDFALKRIVDANVKAEKLFGSNKENLLQGGPERFYHPVQPDGKDIANSMMEYALRALTGEDIIFERAIQTDDGRELICEVWLVHLPYRDQQLLRASFIDITARKNAEVEKQKLEVQLRQSQKMESVGRLAGGVAHDFNNMLSIILGNTEMILDDLDSANPIISNLSEIQKAAERSANLIRQLLAFARKQTISPKELNLNETVEGMLNMLRRLIGENIDLVWLPKINLWSIKFDPSQVDQIMANLCVNARDSIKDVGKITIETDNVSFDSDYCREHDGFNPGDYAMIAVSDNGCGMSKEVLDKLFEPFFTTKGLGEGTGLGLATVYGIIKQNNGFINVYSEPDKGTTFRIYLSRHGENNLVKLKSESKEADARGCETILLVEDEEAILRMTAMMLERLGYTVLAASNTTVAINIGKSHHEKISLLITDVVMPGMNGRDLSKKMIQLFPDLKCLFMSGYTANVIAHHGVLDSGMQFIQKPFSRQDLAKKIREVLDEEK